MIASHAPTGPIAWARPRMACGKFVNRLPYGYTTIGITATGASARHSGFSSAADPRNTARAIPAPVQADRTDTAPVTSSRPAVRGFRASISRSMIRFAAIAKVRSPTMQTVTSSSSAQCMVRSSWNMAVSAAM